MLFIENSDGDDSLDMQEKGLLIIHLASSDQADKRENVFIEIRPEMELRSQSSLQFHPSSKRDATRLDRRREWNMKKPRMLRDKRGIVGIEAAIVLIAFFVIAVALAGVVINMGFYSTQKVKSTISRGISEASSTLQLNGHIIGKTNGTYLIITAFPIKVSVGKSGVDLNVNTTIVSIGENMPARHIPRSDR